MWPALRCHFLRIRKEMTKQWVSWSEVSLPTRNHPEFGSWQSQGHIRFGILWKSLPESFLSWNRLRLWLLLLALSTCLVCANEKYCQCCYDTPAMCNFEKTRLTLKLTTKKQTNNKNSGMPRKVKSALRLFCKKTKCEKRTEQLPRLFALSI